MELEAAQKMATELLNEHNLKDWEFKFISTKRLLGQCWYHRKQINLSRAVARLNPPAIIKEILLHEIAHAKIGANHGHSKKWKASCVSVGAIPQRTLRDVSAVYPEGTITLICPNCNWKREQYQKRKYDKACPYCCNKYNNGKYSEEFKLGIKQTEKLK